MKRLLNITQAAEYVGLSPNVLRDLIARQNFPYINVSRGVKPYYRFDVKELDLWVERQPGLRVKDIKDLPPAPRSSSLNKNLGAGPF